MDCPESWEHGLEVRAVDADDADALQALFARCQDFFVLSQGEPAGDELMHDEGLEELQGHALGQAALVQLEGGSDDDDGASGVVDALAQQVLPEAALLALEQVREALELVVAAASDGAASAQVVPGTGIATSPRGRQSWTDPDHAACIAPGKRPRLTPNPAFAVRDDGLIMPFGTPGGDTQVQVMLQVFLNIFVFAMDPQAAVEAPRVATHSFPSTTDPHPCEPASLYLEGRMDKGLAPSLAALGHRIEWWPERGPAYISQDINGACAILCDPETGVKVAAADPRRPAYALGR